MVDLALILYSAIGALCVAVSIVLWTNRDAWLPALGRLVSILSGNWHASLDRARAQKLQREMIYGYANMSSEEMPEARYPAPAVSNTDTDTGIKPIDTADLALHLTEDQYIEIGALMRNKNGKPLFSGKKLYNLAGGNYNEFVARMRRLRGGDGEVMEESIDYTPIANRPTKAVFESDPELAYQPPD